MNQKKFIEELQKLNINPTIDQLNTLTIYKNLLQEYNQKFNLTAIISDEDIYLKHFYDSLTLTKSFNLNNNLKLLDLGTGAGFPGLVLKIFFPNLEITLLDSNNKKITFLNTVITKLNLKNITTINSRIELLPNTYKESFDIITSRAVSKLSILLELSIPYLKVNGYFLPMKSNINKELEESTNTLNILNSKLIEKFEFNLPIENSKRTILKIQKLKPTAEIYPRSYDKIIKKPLV